MTRILKTGILFCALLISLNAHANDRLALVIGNSTYKDSPLINPGNDAADMADVLRKVGFKVTHLSNLNRSGMAKSIRDFTSELKETGATGAFYYAGHGVEVNGINYLLPLGMNAAESDELEFEAINAQRLLSRMESAGNGLNIIMIDACRNNPYKQFRSLGGTRGMSIMSAPVGSFIASSTASGKVAADGNGRNSPYTKELLKYIPTPGLSLEGVFKKVRVGVLASTNGSQTPWETSSLTTDFFFEPAIAVTAIVGPAEPSGDRSFWQEMKNCGSDICFNAYLATYPKGKYVAAARSQIALNSPAKAKLTDKVDLPVVVKSPAKIDSPSVVVVPTKIDPPAKVKSSIKPRLSAKDKLPTKADSPATYLAKARTLSLSNKPSQAFPYLEKAAKLGDVTGIASIARAYELGLGVKKDSARAKKNYDRVLAILEPRVLKGDPEAELLMGNLYFAGTGVTKDSKRAIELWSSAVEKSNSDAMNMLGTMYLAGLNVKKNHSKAFKLFSNAVSLGNNDARFSLALMYSMGQGVKENDSKAIELFETYSSKGDALTMTLYATNLEYGTSIPKDLKRAEYWYKKAADLGVVMAADGLKRLGN